MSDIQREPLPIGPHSCKRSIRREKVVMYRLTLFEGYVLAGSELPPFNSSFHLLFETSLSLKE